MSSLKLRIPLFSAGFLAFLAFAQPGLATGGQGMTVQWPTTSINLSQLQGILAQNQGIGPVTIQFPNQFNWTVTPDGIQGLVGNAQQAAQAMGVSGKLPDLSFSALAGANSGPQISIPNMMQGNLKGQLDDVMRQLRYQEMNLGDMLPDWLKEFIVAIYDAVYAAFDYVQAQMAALIKLLMG